MLGVGDKAPDFHLPDMQGQKKSLQDFVGAKPALIALFKISCPTCQFTLPFLERLSQGDRLDVVAISQDGPEATEEFRARFGITFPTLLDSAKGGYAVSNAFGIMHVPSLFLVEPGGRIAMAGEGFLKQDLEALGRIAGIEPFRPGEKIPDFKAG